MQVANEVAGRKAPRPDGSIISRAKARARAWREFMERPTTTTAHILTLAIGFLSVVLAIVISAIGATRAVVGEMNDQGNRITLLERQDTANTRAIDDLVFNVNIWQTVWRIQIESNLPRSRAARERILAELDRLKPLQPLPRYRGDYADSAVPKKER